MKLYRLLTVDDDVAICHANQIYFESKGYQVLTARSALEARDLIQKNHFDCILLDICMDDVDGYALCNEIRKKCDTPVIFLTSLSEEDHLLRGFGCGADDFLTKPYSLRELDARVCARIRQHKASLASQTLRFPPLTIHLGSRQVFAGEEALPLTTCEFNILELLASHRGQPFSQSEIYRRVWDMPDLGQASTVQVHIVQLRKKLNAACPDKLFIRTLWGRGYIFVAE